MNVGMDAEGASDDGGLGRKMGGEEEEEGEGKMRRGRKKKVKTTANLVSIIPCFWKNSKTTVANA